MADEIEPHTIQHDQPAKPDVESREETIERVVHEADEAQNVTAREELADPTSRRGVNRAVVRTGGRGGGRRGGAGRRAGRRS